jgi:mannose-6-phosphate isomerase-like protein (cupin superfamily)
VSPPDPLSAGLLAPSLAGERIGAPDADLVLVEWRDPGGGFNPPRYIAPLHVHHDDDEAWYVLEGALRVRVGDEDVLVAAGGAVLVPRGTPHTYWNPESPPTRYVLVMTRRIDALIAALHAVAAPGPESIAAIFRDHRSEYLGWP